MADRLFTFVLACAAVLFQVLALRVFFGPSAVQNDLFIRFFALQILAALSAAMWRTRLHSVQDSHECAWTFLHALLVLLFVPVLGQLLLFAILFRNRESSAGDEGQEPAFVETPRFPTHPIPEVTYGVIGRLRAQLSDPGMSPDDRMAATVAMRSLPLHLTSEILRRLLSDPSEEIRLLAYGIAEAAEKTLMQQIFACKERLNQGAAPVEQAALTSRLAELHWELVYQKLVHGPVHRYTVETAERYARESLALDEGNMDMWCLLGRCALVRHDPHAAGELFEQARSRRFPAGRLSAWMAEAAFERRDYGRVAKFFDSASQAPAGPGVQPAIEYWK